MKTRELFKRFLPYFWRYRWVLVLDLFCAALTTVCELVLPLMVRGITNAALQTPMGLTVQMVLRTGILYIVLRLVDVAANYYMSSIGHVMGARIERDMRRDLFAHLQRLSFSFYSSAKIGQIMSRITTDLFDVTEFAHHCPEEYFIAVLKIAVSFAILAPINLWLTLIVFACMPIMVVCASFFQKRMRRAQMDSRRQLGEINSGVEDSLLGIRVVKSFGNEALEKEKFQKGNEEFVQIKRRQYRYMAGFHSVTRFFDGLMYIAVLVAGGLFLITGGITAADYTAYLLYISTLLNSVRRIVEFADQFNRGMTGVERFCELMDAPVDIEDAPDARPLNAVHGEVELKDVTFGYSDDEHTVLHDVNLHVTPGQSVALVGPSGGGKTTLVSLIPRFYDVQEGQVLVDGQDVRTVTLDSLRANIGVVQQDVYLFSGTVLENIEYGRPGATREEIIEAAKAADAHEFIQALPQGYDTYVGERGVRLSGGQKQRISIARVFLKNPPILILDEATSALDNESERLVQQSLQRLAHGRTTFTIAHRLTTIVNADMILVLTENGIEEQGTHEELMRREHGIYRKLASLYGEGKFRE